MLHENPTTLRISRSQSLNSPSTNEFQLRRDVHLAKLRETVRHTSDPNIFVSGTSANLLYGFDAYPHTATLTFHHRQQRRGTRTIGKKYGPQATYQVSYSHYDLPPQAYVTFQQQRILSIPALVIDHLRSKNPYQAIANAEAVLRGYLHPHPEFRQQSEAACHQLLLEVDKLLHESTYRYKQRIRKRLPLLSPWSESIGESAMKVGLTLAGIPLPQQQLTIFANGQYYRPDAVWPDLHIICEFDGRLKYGDLTGKLVLIKEKEREDNLRMLYPTFIRILWKQAHDANYMASLRRFFPPHVLLPIQDTL
ncbi:MAG: hypothetical protein Q4D73_05720 [Actinomycetaceae bacterium]|nr:hypothetical protein [Actinomycetaceae bacterium]